MRAHENAGFESLGDIMPISPYWVAQKWFSQYFQEGDMPAGTTGFGVVIDPRTGYETVEMMVDPAYDLEDYKRRFSKWLRPPPKSGRFPGVPASGVQVGRVTLSWSDPSLYRFIHVRPVLHGLSGNESEQVIRKIMRGILAQGKRPVMLSVPEIRSGDYIITRDCSLHRVTGFKPKDSVFLEEVHPEKGRRWSSWAWGPKVYPRCAFGGR